MQISLQFDEFFDKKNSKRLDLRFSSKTCWNTLYCNFFTTYLVIFREKAKEKAEKPKSASHQIVPEIEHLLENTTNHTDVHDLGSHTVSVTHFDLDKKVSTKHLNFLKPLRKFINYVRQRVWIYEIIFLFFGNLFKSETCEVEVENCIINAKWRICQVHLTNATFLMIFPHFDAFVVSFYPNGKI